MRIVRIESFCNAFVGFVRVTDEEGAQGWGQLSTYNADISAQVLHRQVAPHVLGQACDDLDALLDTVAEREHKFPGSYTRAGDGRVRHRGLGSARQADRAAGGGAARRSARDAAGLCLVDEARHHARGRGGADVLAARPLRLRRLQGPGRRRGRARSRRVAGADRGDRAADAAGAGGGGGAAGGRQQLLFAGAGDRGRAAARGRGGRALRGALPLLGARADEGSRRRAGDPGDRRRAGLRPDGLAPDDRDARRRRGAAGRALPRRHRADAAGGADGGGGRAAGDAAQRQPVDGDALHHAPARGDPERGQVPRAVDRGARLLSVAGGAVPNVALCGRGRLCHASRPIRDGGWRSSPSGWRRPNIA